MNPKGSRNSASVVGKHSQDASQGAQAAQKYTGVAPTKPQYRSEVGIVAEMLGAISDSGRDGITISSITRKVHVSHNAASKKCQKLIDAGVVKYPKIGKNRRLFITEQGFAFFEQLLEFTDRVRELNIRY